MERLFKCYNRSIYLNYKYNKTEAIDSLTQTLVPLYHPRNHQWTEHFTWNEDYTLVTDKK